MQNIDPLKYQQQPQKTNEDFFQPEQTKIDDIQKQIQIQDQIDDPLQERQISNNQSVDVREYLEFPQYHFFQEQHNFQLISKHRRKNLIEDIFELERAYYLKEYQVDLGSILAQQNDSNVSKIKSTVLETKRKFEASNQKIQIQKIFENEYSKSKIKSKLLKIMTTQGMQFDVRRNVWPNLIENRLRINETLFNIYLQKVCKLNTPLAQIKRDIERTFFHLNQIQEIRMILKEALVLLHIPDIKYIQGMSYSMFLLLLHFPPFMAFKLFSNIILSQNILYKTYHFKHDYINSVHGALEEMVSFCFRDLYVELKQQKLDLWNVFWIEWVYSIFLRSFDLKTSLILWDYMLLLEDKLIFVLTHIIFQEIQEHKNSFNMRDLHREKNYFNKIKKIQFQNIK